MRFLARSLTGILILALTAGLLALALNTLFQAQQARNAERSGGRPAEERIFAVNVETLKAGRATPVITTFGEVASWRTLDIRAATPGTVIELSDAFRDGGRVTRGEVLVRIDPADAQAALDLARAGLAEAEADLADARANLTLASEDVTAAQVQRDLRLQAQRRQQDLLDRGAGTTALLETADLALSSAEQTLLGRRQALAQAEARIDRAEIALRRQGIEVREAERALSDTTITAPFDGLMTAASVLPGGLVSTNEQLGSLIDTGALEISFRVSNAQFARLIRDNGALQDIRVTATLPVGDIPITVAGNVDRAGAEVGEGQTGRLLYARLDAQGAAALRPGDFMTVTISEPPLDGVFVIPAIAANSDGEILLIGEGERLESARVTILRRQADSLIVTGAPDGRDYVTQRQPQLGAGIRVRPLRAGEAGDAAAAAPEMVTLDPARRARLIAFVEGNRRMPKDVRDRLLSQLAEDEVPSDMVARLESRIGG